MLIDSFVAKAHRSASGGKGTAEPSHRALAGSSPDHALTDHECRPIAFLLTRGKVADYETAKALLVSPVHTRVQHSDKGYDTNLIRQRVEP